MVENGIIDVTAVIVLGLVWGSFLNVVGHRLMSGDSLFGCRSRCPHCTGLIRWHDLVPVASYCVLRGTSRCCKLPISFLYPFIEILSAVAAIAIWYDATMWGEPMTALLIGRVVAYSILMSGFVVATRTDLAALVVPRIVIFFMGIAGGIAAVCGMLPVSLLGSAVGVVIGYGSLWLLNYLSVRLTGREGIGEGDMELMAVIGIFWGVLGVWAVASISSLLGTVVAMGYLLMTGKGRETRIPFIPFMAVSSIVYLFLQYRIIEWMCLA